MIATIALFNAYSGNYEDAVLLKTEFLKAAESIVTDYLGFSPEEKEYKKVLLDGTDRGILYLPARNITKLISLTFDGEEKNTSSMILTDDRIEYRTGDVFRKLGKRYISVSFTAGWDDDTIPSQIRLAVLRIATLFQSAKHDCKRLTMDIEAEKYRRKSEALITSDEGIEIRINRSIQAEGSFSLLKGAFGYRRFRMHGIRNIEAEWMILCMAGNALKSSIRLANGRAGTPFWFRIEQQVG